jgi:hypothetical protein
VFDFPERATFQRMNDSFVSYTAKIDADKKTLALTQSADKNWKGNFTFQRLSADQLILDGEMGNHKTHLQLRLVDRNKFLLVNRGFHWVQEYPLNR